MMLDGYLMSEGELQSTPGVKELISKNAPVTCPPWKFLGVEVWMKGTTPSPKLILQLSIARKRLFKVFRLNRRLTVACVVVLLCVSILLKSKLADLLASSLTVGELLSGVIIFTLIVLKPPLMHNLKRMLRSLQARLGTILPSRISPTTSLLQRGSEWLSPVLAFFRAPSQSLFNYVIMTALPILEASIVGTYLWIFDRRFLKLGELERLRNQQEGKVEISGCIQKPNL